MKRFAFLLGFLPLAGCGYLTFDWPPEEQPKKKIEQPAPDTTKDKDKDKKTDQDKEPEYKPTDFPFFKDDDDKMPMGPDSRERPEENPSIPQYRYYQYPGYWYGPQGVYPVVNSWWAGSVFLPRYNVIEHHNHATGASTFEINPSGSFPYGWGFTLEHRHE